MRPAFACAAGLLCLLRPATVRPTKVAGSYDSSDGTELQEVLSHYEIINAEDVESTSTISSTARRRRHVSGVDETGGLLRMQFAALGRKFTLYLTPDTSVYAEGFEAWSVDSTGTKQPILMSDRNLYTGHVHGEIDSHAFLYWSNETMVAKIETTEETYYVEPARGRLPGASSRSMLAYRLSDIRTNRDVNHPSNFRSFCGAEKTEPTVRTSFKTGVPQGQRSKREVPIRNSCPLFLIADYRFFRDVANGSETAAILIMINRAQTVDKIFRRTKWTNGWTNLGISVRKILVHKSWTSGDSHYNADRHWTENELLWALQNVPEHEEPFNTFCLVHLFTGYQFNGILGYAIVGIPKVDHGICANYLMTDADITHDNVGFSTQFGRSRRRLLESEAETLLAHELGHGWGSGHDPNTTECSPDPNDLYIMAKIADPHPKQNAKLFSPCSVKQMTKVIIGNYEKCFEVDRNPTRGNYRIDAGEQCDAGITGDNCCGSDFQLKIFDACSDANHICCHNCSAEEALGRICQFESAIHCRAEAVCNGVDVTCPITFRENGSACFPDGSGRCLPQTDGSQEAVYCATMCETLGFRSCRCSDASSMCKLCCQQQPGSPCSVLRRIDYENAVYQCVNHTTRHCRRGDQFAFEPYEWKSDVFALPPDSPCLLGYCDSEGVCRKQPQDVLTIGKLLASMTPSEAVQVMKDNIVGTIIVFSLILWVPASVCVKLIDRRKEREELRGRLDSACPSDWVSPHVARRNNPNVTFSPSHVAIR